MHLDQCAVPGVGPHSLAGASPSRDCPIANHIQSARLLTLCICSLAASGESDLHSCMAIPVSTTVLPVTLWLAFQPEQQIEFFKGTDT